MDALPRSRHQRLPAKMMKPNSLLLNCAISANLLLLSSLAYSQPTSPSPIARMNELIAAENYQAAYDLGQESLVDWEGEEGFDFALGLAAIEAGVPNEAVYAFQRVAATASNQVLRERARLELARAYFLTNNLGAAENLFNEVLEANPPANVQQNIQAFLQLIDARQQAQAPSFNFTLSSAIGSDTNINSATSNGLIDTPLIGQIELNQDGQETDDSYSSSIFTASYNRPFTRNTALQVSATLNHLDNIDTDQFDIDTLRGEVAYLWGNDTNRIRHGITANKVNLDQNGFQDSLGINTSWQHIGSNGWYQTAAISWTQIRYATNNGGFDNDLRDVDQALINLGLTKITQGFTHSLNVYHADESAQSEDPRGDQNGRSFTGLAYSLMYRLNQEHTPFFRTSVQEVKHDDNHPVFFDRVRDDSTESVSVGWLWNLRSNFTLTAEATYTDTESNIPLFDYSRFKYQAGFRFRF